MKTKDTRGKLKQKAIRLTWLLNSASILQTPLFLYLSHLSVIEEFNYKLKSAKLVSLHMPPYLPLKQGPEMGSRGVGTLRIL